MGWRRAVLGVPVQRQIGEHHAEALSELLGRRLPLLVGQERGVEQRERRPGPELAVGHARTVGVVIQAKPHGCIVRAPTFLSRGPVPGTAVGPTYNGPPRDGTSTTPAHPAPGRRSSTGAARARAAGARALARARRVRRVAAPARGRRAVGVLRGAAHRERSAGLPPRALARVQGHLPPLSDDARLPGGAQGRLGLPRAAGRDRRRTGARHPLEGGDRGVRDRALQRAVPRVGVHVPRGVEPADRADRLLARPRRRLPHAR